MRAGRLEGRECVKKDRRTCAWLAANTGRSTMRDIESATAISTSTWRIIAIAKLLGIGRGTPRAGDSLSASVFLSSGRKPLGARQ